LAQRISLDMPVLKAFTPAWQQLDAKMFFKGIQHIRQRLFLAAYSYPRPKPARAFSADS
jgi:hypothetical protein